MARAVACAIACFLVGGCRSDARAKLEETRTALVHGDVAGALSTVDPRECRGEADPSACLTSLVVALDPRATFSTRAPDDASLAAVGLWLLRAHRGASVPGGEAWLASMAGAVGPGADVLRLAVASEMEDQAHVVRKSTDDAAHRGAVADAVAQAVPGATGTSREPGHGWSDRYGRAVDEWVAASHALDLGQDRMTGEARVALGRHLGVVRVATSELESRRAEQGDAGQP